MAWRRYCSPWLARVSLGSYAAPAGKKFKGSASRSSSPTEHVGAHLMICDVNEMSIPFSDACLFAKRDTMLVHMRACTQVSMEWYGMEAHEMAWHGTAKRKFATSPQSPYKPHRAGFPKNQLPHILALRDMFSATSRAKGSQKSSMPSCPSHMDPYASCCYGPES